MKVLIAEDGEDDRLFLKTNLKGYGCEVIEARDGEEGLVLTKLHKPDLIISDALMPRMDGFQFLRAVKTDEALKDIPFIFYSAVYTGYKEAELAVSIGAEAFIIKPKETDEFWKEVIEIVEESRLKKQKPVAAELIEEDEEFLRRYSHIVASKLEEKVRELLKEAEERKKAMDSLCESENRYRLIAENVKDVIWTMDMNLHYTYLSPSVVHLRGYTAEEGMRQTIEEVLTPASLKLVKDVIAEELDINKLDKKNHSWSRVLHLELMHKDGYVVWAEANISPLRDTDGNTIGVLGVTRDITERRKLEEQLQQSQKMEAVGQLAGGVAHDFNNILTAIIGYAHVLKMKMKEDEPLRTYIEPVLSLCDRAANLVQSLLAFSRKQMLSRRPVELNEIIRQTEKFLIRVIGEDIRLATVLVSDDLTVMADPVQIEQVLMNLATNARDAMPEGGVLMIETESAVMDRKFIEARGYGKAGRYALITITDSGKGMDALTRSRIFEPFFTTKEVGKGTGLGLSMVYGTISQHDGYVGVESEPGKGTTFRIYLPLIKQKIKEMVPLPATVPLTPKGEIKATLLIAEDDSGLREALKLMLREDGYKVFEASDGEDAVDVFTKHEAEIEMLLIDVIMPKKNGKEVYEDIKKMKPEVKVLFISGYPSDIIHGKGILDPGMEFISKPVSPDELIKKIQETMKK